MSGEIDWNVPKIFKWPEKPLGFLVSHRWIPGKPDHGEQYLSLGYQILPSLRAGIDYRPLTRDIGALVNWRVFPENDTWRPALMLGTSNDDFGNINSQSYFATLSKALPPWKDITVSPFIGANYIEKLDDVRPIGGLHLRRRQFSIMFAHSGVDEHLTFSYNLGNHTFSILFFDLRLPGTAWSFRF